MAASKVKSGEKPEKKTPASPRSSSKSKAGLPKKASGRSAPRREKKGTSQKAKQPGKTGTSQSSKRPQTDPKSSPQGPKPPTKGKSSPSSRKEDRKDERKRQKEEQARRTAARQELEKQLAEEDSQAYENLLRRRSSWKRKRRRRLYIFLLVVLAAAGFFLCCRMFLTISTIKITGQSRYTDDELVRSSGLMLGDNLYDFEPEEIAKKILDGHIYLETVTVHRLLPTTVEIQVTPVLETGVVKGEAGFSIISTGGKVLETGILYPPSELPIITGIQLSVSRSDNEELANIMDKRLEVLSDINRALTENKLTGITAIDLSDSMNLTITYQDRVKINLGNKDKLSEKIRLAVKVLAEVDPSQEGTLNLSIEKKGFFRAEGIHGNFAPLTTPDFPLLDESELSASSENPQGEGDSIGESSSGS